MRASLSEIDYAHFLSVRQLAIFRFCGVTDKRREGLRGLTGRHLAGDRFRAVLCSLKEAGTALSLDDYLAIGRAGRGLPEHAFAVTFDIGYKTAATVAAPILEELRIPATFYLTTALAGTSQAPWIDEVEYAFERAEEVRLEGMPDPALHAPCRTFAEKLALLERIRAIIAHHPAVDPGAFAREVWRQLGVREMEADPGLDPKLAWAEIRELARNSLFKVGGHGHTYRALSALSPGDLDREVSESVSRLGRHLGEFPRHYSYPEGTDLGVSPRVIESLRAHGVVCAPTSMPGVNGVGDDPFRLKRISVT